jgi:glycosyltransferase involved in cell wall biosynthesis
VNQSKIERAVTDDMPATLALRKLQVENCRLGYDLDDLRVENRRLRKALEQMQDEVLRLSRALEPMHALQEERALLLDKVEQSQVTGPAHSERAEMLAAKLQALQVERALLLDKVEQSQVTGRAHSERAEMLAAKLHAVYASSSWRLTYPLRWAKRQLPGKAWKLTARLLPRRSWFPRNVGERQGWFRSLYGANMAIELLRWVGVDARMDKATRNSLPKRELWLLEGPFDSSYSLAVVNRELAKALARAGEQMALVSRDGPGPFAPDRAFLALNPDIDEMVQRADPETDPSVTLRNQYPPQVMNMRGQLRVLSTYAWEESGLSVEWVREFNKTLDLITVPSTFVAKILRDNGVHVPIHVVGEGGDHVLGSDGVAARSRHEDGPFRFLHVSSCFPRKGVDVLLAAWGAAFTKHDPVELVIKTFPNIHNNVDAEIRAFEERHPHAPAITLINQNIDAAAMWTLYGSAGALVCPTRGEGFGLPLAEALAMGKPVITTGYGGQSDFCRPDTAWLCDYRFDYARTHFDVVNSVWVEPDVESLAGLLREVFEAPPSERLRRADAGRTLILSRYTWDLVARRTQSAIAAARKSSSANPRLPTIGVISTWNSRCGIAAYAQSLLGGISPERLRVFASKVAEALRPDESFVSRCWIEGWNDPLNDLFLEVQAAHLDVVVLQFNFGFFQPAALKRLLDKLHFEGILVFMTMHATMDVDLPDMKVRLGDIREELARICRLLVHSVHDLNRLKDIGLVENVALFPMGLPQPFAGDRQAIRHSLGLDGKTIVASFGYLLPNKGLPELIRAFALVHAKLPDTHLLMLNALYPVAASEEERDACLDEIRRLGIQYGVTLVTDFLDEGEVLARLAAATIVVYPYQRTQESASAAVKMGFASGAAVAVTPLPIFADVMTMSHVLPGTSPADIADGLMSLLSDPVRRSVLQEQQRAWVAAHDWATLSDRLDGLIRGEVYAHTTSDVSRGLVWT